MKIFIVAMIFVRYSYQSLTYVPTNITEMDLMLKRLNSILSNCKADELHYVGLVRSSEIPELWSSAFMKNIPAIRLKISSDPRARLHSTSIYYDNLFRHDKLHVFVTFVTSPSNFRYIIERLMESIWWNPLALYVIIDTAVYTCHQPEDYLSIAWRSDLEFSEYFCIDPIDKDYTAYTYNRHGNPAPSIWRPVASSIDNDNRWNHVGMLRHILQNKTTCENLNFHKQIKLGGYTVKLVGVPFPPTLSFNKQEKGMKRYGGMNGLVLTTLFDKMNATMSVVMLRMDDKIHSLLENVSNGEYDILMNSQYIYDKLDYLTVYPHLESGLSILTRPSGFDPNVVKIIKFISPQLIGGILSISILTVFVLGVLAGRGLSSACLEVARITVNTSVLRFPRRTPLRIYLITVLLLFLISGSSFQSSLSSILTSSASKPNVDNSDALREAGYTIYTFANYKSAIFDSVLQSRVRGTDTRDCSQYVIDYPNTACVADRSRLMRLAFDNNLHMSSRRLINLYQAYVTRPNFPLVKRIGRVLMSMSQSGLIDYWYEETVAVYKNRWRMKAHEMKMRKFRKMNIKDLMFAFFILFSGLGASVVTFLVELSVLYRKRSRSDKQRRTRKKILSRFCTRRQKP